MARYLHRNRPRYNRYVGIVVRDWGHNTSLQAVNGHRLGAAIVWRGL